MLWFPRVYHFWRMYYKSLLLMPKDPLLATPAVSTETQLDLAHDPNNGSIILGLSLQGPPRHQCGDVSALATGSLSIWWRPSSVTGGLEEGMGGFWENSWQWEKQALLFALQVLGHARLLMKEHHNWELRKESWPLTLDSCFPRLYQDAAQLGLYFC